MDITDSCLDAETLAAWADGGLSGSELARVQSHVADCVRCQEMVGALGRINAAIPATEARPERSRWLSWLLPASAAVAAVAVFWVMSPPRLPEPQSQQAANPQAEERQTPAAAPPAAPRTVEPGAVSENARPQDRLSRSAAPVGGVTDLRRDAKKDSAIDTMNNASPEPTPRQSLEAPASPQRNAEVKTESGQMAVRREMAAAGAGAAGVQPLDVVSPDPAVRWRVTGSVVQRSTNGGRDWEITPTGVTQPLLAGSAPSAVVCWMVGRGGIVLLSTDGRIWRRVPFPETSDLSGVRARDARAASVTTADGRTLSTTDAGGTWVPGPLQGFSRPPF